LSNFTISSTPQIFYFINNTFFFNFSTPQTIKLSSFSNRFLSDLIYANYNFFTIFNSFKTLKSFFTIFRLNFIKPKFFYSYIHLKGIGFKLYRSTNTNSLIVNSGYNHYTKITYPILINLIVRKFYVLIYSSAVKHNYYVNVLRNIRYPDPYRAKGFRFKSQIIKLKIGKQRLQK
jgi:hypothetical protein